MKRIRGSGLFLVLLFPVWLWAETTYQWSVKQSKTAAVQFESVVLEYRCQFDTEGYEYIIAFDPPKETETYRMVLESAEEQIIDLKRVNTYRFLVFPKKAGDFTLALSATMEHTSKASIENTVIGRDNVEKIDYTARTVPLPDVSVTVKPNESGIAGHLQLSVEADRKSVDAFSPVQVGMRLQGYGNLEDLEPFGIDIPGATLFSDGPRSRLIKGDNGFEGSIEQQYAVVAERNFTVPSVRLRYFDVEQNRIVTLVSEPITVHVHPAVSAADNGTVYPERVENHPDAGWSWLHLLMALTAGLIIGRFLLPAHADGKKPMTLPEKISRSKTPETFVTYLAMYDAQRYRGMIDDIERKIKQGETIDLASYKRQL